MQERLKNQVLIGDFTLSSGENLDKGGAFPLPVTSLDTLHSVETSITPLVKDLFHLVFEMVGFVNTFWGVYATATIALLGWLFSSKYIWPRQQRIAITVAYALVVGINCAAQCRFNLLLCAAVTELNSAIAKDPILQNAFSKATRNVWLLPTPALVVIHVVIDLAVIYLIWIQHQFRQSHESTDKKEV